MLGLAFHVAIRRPPLRQLNVRFWDAWKDIWPKFLPHERVGPGQHMAAALIGCRMAYNEDGWRVGDEVFKKDTEAFARVRRAFGAQDSKTTLKAYRLQKQEANLSSKTLARVVYHLRYLST